jgi:Bacterial PH domain
MIVFEDNEYVIHTARKHWIVFALRFVFLLIATLIPLAVVPFLHMIDRIPFETVIATFSFFYVAYLLGMWIWGFLMWTDYYLDITVITNKRVIDMEQKGLFSREISTMRYEAIQDVTTDIKGVLHTLLNYGNLYIQTAATTKEFILDDIYNPNLAKEIIVRELSRVLEKPE